MIVIRKGKPRLLKIDEYSATALLLFVSDYNHVILDDQCTLKVNLAQAVAYHVKNLFGIEKEISSNEWRIIRTKRSPKKEFINPFIERSDILKMIDYAHYYQLHEKIEKTLSSLKTVKTLQERRAFVEDFLRFAGELLESKITKSTTKKLNARVQKTLSELLGSIDSLTTFRDLKTHGQFCRDIELSGDLVDRFTGKNLSDGVLFGMKEAFVLMNKLETDHIAEFFQKYNGSESFLRNQGLSVEKLEGVGIKDIREKIDCLEDSFDKGAKVNSLLDKMLTGKIENFNPGVVAKRHKVRKDIKNILL